MARTKTTSTEEVKGEVSRTQHGALNNLNMIMFWIRKTKLTEDQLQRIESITSEILTEIKP